MSRLAGRTTSVERGAQRWSGAINGASPSLACETGENRDRETIASPPLRSGGGGPREAWWRGQGRRQLGSATTKAGLGVRATCNSQGGFHGGRSSPGPHGDMRETRGSGVPRRTGVSWQLSRSRSWMRVRGPDKVGSYFFRNSQAPPSFLVSAAARTRRPA